MLNFLAPGALFGLLALAIPTVLHLRRPPPPTVRVGSLRHLQTLPKIRPTWWRWRDLVRLALRLALLTLLTFAIAHPRWQWSANGRPRHWSLVDPSGALDGALQEKLKTRRTAGEETRWLAEGFPQALPGQKVDTANSPSPDLWSLLRELDARLPTGSSLTVFSPARLDELRGVRPTLGNVTVDWVETPPAVKATAPPSIRVVRKEPALRVLIFHTPERVEDARRLATAIRATTPPGGPRPEPLVALNPGPGQSDQSPDWVFSLGGPPPAGAVGVKDARNFFTDAGETPFSEERLPPGLLVAPELAGGQDVLLRRRVVMNGVDRTEVVHWMDSLGLPVLTAKAPDSNGQRRWRFGGRFDPAWNDLTETTALAETLRAWFFPVTGPTLDERLAGAEQARPEKGESGSHPAWPWPSDSLALLPTTDLWPWALSLATIGFLLERVWALRQPVKLNR